MTPKVNILYIEVLSRKKTMEKYFFINKNDVEPFRDRELERRKKS